MLVSGKKIIPSIFDRSESPGLTSVLCVCFLILLMISYDEFANNIFYATHSMANLQYFQ